MMKIDPANIDPANTATIQTPIAQRVSWALLFLRIGIFIPLLIWVIDKFVQPEHAAGVFQAFYGIGGVPVGLVYVLGVVQLLILIGFGLGYQKRITYGLVLLMHTASTLVAFPKYFAPFEGANILFYAAWPMLAACLALYTLRDLDTRGTIS